jgi:hypothetical protein
MEFQKREFVRMLRQMTKLPGYTPACQTVFLQLNEWCSAVNGQTCPAQGVIARECGLVRETVNRVCKWLENNCFIRTTQRRKRQADGRVWFLSKWYRLAEDLEHIDWLRQRRLQDIVANLGKTIGARVAYPASPPPYKAPPPVDKQAVMAYWLGEMAKADPNFKPKMPKLPCDFKRTVPSSSVSLSDMLKEHRRKNRSK